MTEPTAELPAEPAAQPTDTTDWKAEARKWEERAKENRKAQTELEKIKQAQMSDLERAQATATASAKEAADAKAEALRWRIAAKHGISDQDAETFLTGTDEASLIKQAERLAALNKTTTASSPAPRPDLTQGGKAITATGSPEQDFADFLQNALSKT